MTYRHLLIALTAAMLSLPLYGVAQQSLRDCPQCPEMVRIPPGSFMMGAAPGEHARENIPPFDWAKSELPQHKVTIGYAFSLGKYEVTRGEFAAFVQATRHQAGKTCWSHDADGQWAEIQGRIWQDPGFAQTDRDPVVCVSWNDAKAYVAWLSRTTGKTYRLPSETEWEYAARAGAPGARYWGDSRDGACRYGNFFDFTFAERLNRPKGGPDQFMCADGHVYTAPVGRFQPNDYGLYDMLGNAGEWTEDCWNERYAGAPANGSSWQRGDCSRRVVRGGSWALNAWSARAASRAWDRVGGHSHGVGFRVARTD